ncbi:uncharacterized protein C8Q71DRAFT_786757 [Rhodofomes roseus]|uniref:Uncharacterized protein n=1 Tax=Rhodofomes roseus TaxID=34475 RepID=A0ABQ8K0X3_9APHY|nr:uncharacterized protein C8Q71DRAFT_786757 [Rhodofomes roseus]KAH9830306.1 hypothetical protein C8Q71DRAFT_786757 [Rhodofomes roseus]
MVPLNNERHAVDVQEDNIPHLYAIRKLLSDRSSMHRVQSRCMALIQLLTRCRQGMSLCLPFLLAILPSVTGSDRCPSFPGMEHTTVSKRKTIHGSLTRSKPSRPSARKTAVSTQYSQVSCGSREAIASRAQADTPATYLDLYISRLQSTLWVTVRCTPFVTSKPNLPDLTGAIALCFVIPGWPGECCADPVYLEEPPMVCRPSGRYKMAR